MKEISAGGVVFRGRGERTELLLIRDRFGRITLPKGKMEPGESLEQTALREILEETGITGRIAAKLEVTVYRYDHPQLGPVEKEVHYYLVEADGGNTSAQLEEISEAFWARASEASDLMAREGYDNNRSVLRRGLERLQTDIG